MGTDENPFSSSNCNELVFGRINFYQQWTEIMQAAAYYIKDGGRSQKRSRWTSIVNRMNKTDEI